MSDTAMCLDVTTVRTLLLLADTALLVIALLFMLTAPKDWKAVGTTFVLLFSGISIAGRIANVW
jgi:hypothetical protein